MKYALLILLTFWSGFTTANELYFQPALFKSSYETGKGRAWLRMTATPGYVIVTRDLNNCNFLGICENRQLPGNIEDSLYLLAKTTEVNGKLLYRAIPVATGVDQEKLHPEAPQGFFNITIDSESTPYRSWAFIKTAEGVNYLPLTMSLSISTPTQPQTLTYVLNLELSDISPTGRTAFP